MPWNALTVLPGLNASDMKIGLLITARMGSTRLKDKHLQTIGNHLALDCLLGRVRNEFAAELLSGVSTIWIATGNPDRNQAFNQFANGLTVRVFNGDDDNVPLRHLQLARAHELNGILSIDGDDIFCAPEAMRAVYEKLRHGASLAKTTGFPLGMNAWGYTTSTLEHCLEGASATLLETGWGRIFDGVAIEVVDLACPDAEQVRATLDYPEDLHFFDACARQITDWTSVSTPDLVRHILKRDLHSLNASVSLQYWENFQMNINREQSVLAERSYNDRLHTVIPGGAHTYSRGSDQYPSNAPEILERGKGVYVWTPENKRYLDYGMALRAVSIGYAESAINEAAIRGLEAGNSLTRASTIELAAAEKLVSMIDSVDMVKFTKNGSTATSAAVKLARAYTGRDMVARCAQHPFFSYDDWFIGSTPITKGIPAQTIELTKTFNYNDIASLQALIDAYPGQLACVIMEPASTDCPATALESAGCCGQAVCTRHQGRPRNYLQDVQDLCRKHGIMFILDETITGFRWHMKGAQHVYGVEPDLCTFGKAMANGFSVAAVAGRREIMDLGSINKPGQERLFLLSTTHGAEMSGLSAFMATTDYLEEHRVLDHLWSYGAALKQAINDSAAKHGIAQYFYAAGPAANPYYVTATEDGQPWFELRTLFAQEMIKQDILMPWLSVSYRHGDDELVRTRRALDEALGVCARGVAEGVDKYLIGPSIKPVFRRYN